ncbi:hypothetical protein V1514DRAFT_290807 [Lipomyces japonicus]|uniref:uncharacterized protein n=1 Tax=Lipomyces japonicus TaxID=56871 RepID=UPI0034CEEF49
MLIWAKVYADVEFLTPAASDSYAASSLVITWQDSDLVPSLDDLVSTTIILCTGPNTDIVPLQELANEVSLSSLGESYSVTITPSLAANGLFYLQMTSTISSGGYVINYSDRFYLTGMTGSLEPTGAGDPPSRELHSGSSVSNSFTVPYEDQEGWTLKYAPMQKQPGHSVTATTYSRQYPSEAVTTTFLTNTLQPYAQSTTTMGWTYTPSSAINDASAALLPSQNGGSYEAKKKKKRWED